MKLLTYLLLFISFAIANTDIYIDISQEKVFVGDKVQVTIATKSSEVLNIEFPTLDVDNEDITLSTTSSNDSLMVLSLQFWRPGNHNFPSIKIRALHKDSLLNYIYSDPIEFNILDRDGDTQGELRESKINKEMSLPLTINQLILILIIFMALIAAYVFFKKKENQTLAKNAMHNIDFFNIAVNDLDELVLPTEMGSIKLEEFYISLSNILKRYLQAKFFFSATKMTTDEILDYLKIKEVTTDGLEDLLEEADLCKFAQKKYGVTTLLEAKKSVKSLLINFESVAF
ncbi:MAG: hypothetical protein H8E72_03060 [Candidatus Marinimicrobia bacterium]|nr:hypothetical protein [Candidatus Neomarinimicrobiota bacterium]